ncbi:MAG: ribbon-helix-helix protein, CopG family [Coriobacteriia bacterium]|nr:ribbon-helix-helix protein, CopG family [Coriobacteriia bacterium]
MPKKKIAIALSDWLLEELDESAGSMERSRSSLVEEAVADYVTARRARLKREGHAERVEAAVADMEAFAREVTADPLSADEPSTLEKLRALRAEVEPWEHD